MLPSGRYRLQHFVRFYAKINFRVDSFQVDFKMHLPKQIGHLLNKFEAQKKPLVISS